MQVKYLFIGNDCHQKLIECTVQPHSLNIYNTVQLVRIHSTRSGLSFNKRSATVRTILSFFITISIGYSKVKINNW